MSERCIIISDLHLGDGGPRDDFHADTELCFFLELHRDVLIVLAGDIFEMWQIRDPREIQRAHPAVCKAIEEHVDFAVRGNHDGDLARICGIPLAEGLLVDGVLVIHGHQFDAFNHGRFRFVGRAATWLAGGMELIHRDADVWLGKAATWLLRRGRHSKPEAYTKAAHRSLRESAARHPRGIAMGHTHTKDQSWGYWNSGTWTGSRRDYAMFYLGSGADVKKLGRREVEELL